MTMTTDKDDPQRGGPGPSRHEERAVNEDAKNEDVNQDVTASGLAEVERLLRLAARERPLPDPVLVQRILADADAVLCAAAGPAPPVAPVAPAHPWRPRRLRLRRARARVAQPGQSARSGRRAGGLSLIGGWPALAGLASAALVGVWIGYAMPAPAARPAGAPGTGQDSGLSAFMPTYDDILAGG